MKILHKNWNTDFIGHRKWGYTLSIVMLVVSLVSFCTRGLNYGIDFKGGISIEASAATPIDVAAVREKLSSLNTEKLRSRGLIKARLKDLCSARSNAAWRATGNVPYRLCRAR